MVTIEGYRYHPDDGMYEYYAAKFPDREVYIVPALSVNMVQVEDEVTHGQRVQVNPETNSAVLDENGEPVYEGFNVTTPQPDRVKYPSESPLYTKSALRRMRRVRSFINVNESELMLALTAGDDATPRQVQLIELQAGDFNKADTWYEEMKASNMAQLSGMTVTELEDLAEEMGHELTGSTKSMKIDSLTADLF